MPLLTITDADLQGPLLARQYDDADDFTIEIDAGEHGRRTVGRIMRVQRASGTDRGAWFWTMTGPTVPSAGVALFGDAGSLAEARQEFRGAWPAAGVGSLQGLCCASVARAGGEGRSLVRAGVQGRTHSSKHSPASEAFVDV